MYFSRTECDGHASHHHDKGVSVDLAIVRQLMAIQRSFLTVESARGGDRAFRFWSLAMAVPGIAGTNDSVLDALDEVGYQRRKTRRIRGR